MKVLAQRIFTSSSYAKVIEWGKIISITGSAQIIVQGLGFVSGIMIIRLLSTQEYALYTLANTMIGTMVVLADGGISTGVMAEGGKVWQDHEKLGAILATGLNLRRKFAIISLLIAIPALLFLLHQHGASIYMAALISMAIIPAFYTMLSGTILEIAPKLHQDITPLQKIAVLASASRLGLLSITILSFPFAFVAILASGLPQVWANWQTRKISSHYATSSQKPVLIIRQEILKKVKRLLPLSIYYCLSGQITIWLVSIFGSTTTIAQVGALGRLSVILSTIGMLFSVLIVPRFARLPNNRRLLINWYLLIHFILLIISLLIIVIVWLFPEQILWVLGKEYTNLTKEVTITIIASCLNMIAGSSFSLYSHRGLIMRPAIGIAIGLSIIIAGILLVDVSTLQGALLYSIFTAAFAVAINFTYGLLKIHNTTIS